MSKKRKVKLRSFYIDTQIALDYAADRNKETIFVLDCIKNRRWKLVSSTFLSMEMVDYKKEELFIQDKIFNHKWDLRRAYRDTPSMSLKASEFEKVNDWFYRFKERYQRIELLNFIIDANGWALATDISFNSNLKAPDVIHVCSAILGASTGSCDVMISNDKSLRTEALKIIEGKKLKSKLRIMTIAEVKNKYFNQRRI